MKNLFRSSFTAHPTIWVLACISLIPIFLIGTSCLIMTQDLADAAEWFLSHFKPFFFEYLILLFACGLLYAASQKLWVSSLLPGTALILLTLISHYKTVINGTPLLLSDFSFAMQFSEIAKFALPQITISTYTAVALITFLLVCIMLFFIDKSLNKTRRLRAAIAIMSTTCTAVFLFSPLFTTWAVHLDDGALSQEERAVEYGVALGLYCTYAHDLKLDATLTRPDFLQEQVGVAKEPSEEPEQLPTVIFLMSESFFDVTKLPNVKFPEDPIPVFHSLAAEHTSGNFLSSTYCGGTAWVEMEVLTGISRNLLKEADTLSSLPPDTYENIPAISDVFKSYGYGTTFLHSYNSDLYNREMIYSQFGFDRILFDHCFDANAERRGGYISDMELSKKIISLYEENVEQPMFMYAVSMENHQPYNSEKFADDTSIGVKSDALSEGEQVVLEAYTTGLRDADQALGYLVEYFSACENPVMIVFFGDHLPNLGANDGDAVYSKLGYSSTAVTTDWQPDELAKMLSTDYLIWTNYEEEPLPDKAESCTWLGLSVLNRLNFHLDDYFSWLDRHVTPTMLLYRPSLFVDSQGNAYESIPKRYEAAMNDYRTAIHDILYGEQLIFHAQRDGGSE